jgi:hypothetical protein
VLVRLGQQLLVVREATLHQARGQHHVVHGEDDLVLQRGHADALAGPGAGDSSQLLQRARRDVGLERALERLLELGLLDGQAIRVGGDHP